MNKKQLRDLGVTGGDVVRLAAKLCSEARSAGLSKSEMARQVEIVAKDPENHTDHPHFGRLAKVMLQCGISASNPAPAKGPGRRKGAVIPHEPFVPRDAPAPWRQWGDDLDDNAIEQMRYACDLPVATRGALMPDAHMGYGLPIGGVLATENAVIPYAVGVDIACRMKLTVLDMPVGMLQGESERLANALEAETAFGVGAEFKKRRRQHEVLDEDWSVSPITKRNKDKAHAQLGSSGSGNHFVEYGELHVDAINAGALGLPAEDGVYLAVLSHSGSRGCGAAVCDHYSKLAMEQHPELPKPLQHLAWLDLDSETGQEYWAAMNLMGRYAAANHAMIHKHIAKHLGAKVIAGVENHHNFAWEEEHDGKTVIVHRKGATPAGDGVLGVIPGSMASPCYVVTGKGSDASMKSAAHGAGRVMSRKKAKESYRWGPVKDYLKHRGVTLLSAGLDEVPFVYKDIDEVMANQRDLVDVVARFDPRIVKMAPGGRAED